ncbi:hypothetical protein NA57DRAFT_54385 [Rhizodiscina lignyota]|uniref:Leucine-rich repeat-containing protein sog2 n=1 Tax=Rhizodiscina lignyota TaxID=1504668 RepID=A0A9P4IHW3_9PEZI|nr:hypothetical protein NA57DRAFT_54385 [Rhizodiscina lignyota]
MLPDLDEILRRLDSVDLSPPHSAPLNTRPPLLDKSSQESISKIVSTDSAHQPVAGPVSSPLITTSMNNPSLMKPTSRYFSGGKEVSEAAILMASEAIREAKNKSPQTFTAPSAQDEKGDERDGMDFDDEPYDDAEADVIDAVATDVDKISTGVQPRPKAFAQFKNDGLDLNLAAGRTGVRLTRLPLAIVHKTGPNLLRLQLSGNNLNAEQALPKGFAECRKLYYLKLEQCNLQYIPRPVYLPPKLVILDVSNNHISAIPTGLVLLQRLRIFSIAHNELKRLPGFLAQLPELQTLQIADNPLEEPPRLVWDKRIPENQGLSDQDITKRVLDWLSENREDEFVDIENWRKGRENEMGVDPAADTYATASSSKLSLSSIATTSLSTERDSTRRRAGLAPPPLNISKISLPFTASSLTSSTTPTSASQNLAASPIEPASATSSSFAFDFPQTSTQPAGTLSPERPSTSFSMSSNTTARMRPSPRTFENSPSSSSALDPGTPIVRPATSHAPRSIELDVHARIERRRPRPGPALDTHTQNRLQLRLIKAQAIAYNSYANIIRGILNNANESNPGIFSNVLDDAAKVRDTLAAIRAVTSDIIAEIEEAQQEDIPHGTPFVDAMEQEHAQVGQDFRVIVDFLLDVAEILPERIVNQIVHANEVVDWELTQALIERGMVPAGGHSALPPGPSHVGQGLASLARGSADGTVTFSFMGRTVIAGPIPEEPEEEQEDYQEEARAQSVTPSAMRSRDEQLHMALHNLLDAVSSSTDTIRRGLSEYMSSGAQRNASSEARTAFTNATMKLQEAEDAAKALTEQLSYVDASSPVGLQQPTNELLNTVSDLILNLALVMRSNPELQRAGKAPAGQLRTAAKAVVEALGAPASARRINTSAAAAEGVTGGNTPVTPLGAALGPGPSRLVGKDTSGVFKRIEEMNKRAGGRF